VNDLNDGTDVTTDIDDSANRPVWKVVSRNKFGYGNNGFIHSGVFG
jgi:hypothetical protein